MKGRVVNLGDISAATLMATWELSRHIKYVEPLVIVARQISDTLSVFGRKQKFADMINMDKVPEGTMFARHDYTGKTGVVFRDRDVIVIRIMHKGLDMSIVRSAFFGAIKGVLWGDFNVEADVSKHRIESNDMVFKAPDGRLKKFCGAVPDPRNGIYSAVVTLKFNADKIKGLYKMDAPKMKQRGDFKEITEVVGGLTEANPLIGDDLASRIIIAFGEAIGWEIEGSRLTDDEQSVLEEIGNELSNPLWIMEGKR